MPDDPAPYRAPRGSERWILAASFVIALLAFGAIVLEDYQPAKLAPVFMLLSWFPLIALHELGHALAARAAGWRVETIVVGFGGVALAFEGFGITWVLKMYPLGGYVRPVATSVGGYRIKSAMVYLAGPAVELGLVALLVAFLGFDAMTTRTASVPLIAAQSVSAAALFSAISNLIPRRIDTERGVSLTDGLGILRSFLRPTGEVRLEVRQNFVVQIEDRMLAGDLEGTVEACEQAHRALPDDPHVRTTISRALEHIFRGEPLAVRQRVLHGRRLPSQALARAGADP